MYPHLNTIVTASGRKTTIRTPFASMLYNLLFGGEDKQLDKIVKTYAEGISTLLRGEEFDCLVMIPPLPTRPDYVYAIRLVTEISRISGIFSVQHAIKHFPIETPRIRFAFTSDAVSGIFVHTRTLVITDFYRSGRTLHSFCKFLRDQGQAECIRVLSGTVVNFENANQ